MEAKEGRGAEAKYGMRGKRREEGRKRSGNKVKDRDGWMIK